jgi:hypothetical protein
MDEQKTVTVDELCQQALQAKLNLYQERERLDVVQKIYNDCLDNLINVVKLLNKNLIEKEQAKEKKE